MFPTSRGFADSARSSQSFTGIPIESVLEPPAGGHYLGYPIDLSTPRTTNILQKRGQSCLKEKYLKIGEELGIRDFSISDLPRPELSGISEIERVWGSLSFPQENPFWGEALGTTLESPIASNPIAPYSFGRSASAEASNPANLQIQCRDCQKINMPLPDWREVFPNGLNSFELPTLPAEFKISNFLRAAVNIFSVPFEDLEQKNYLSAVAIRFLKDLRNSSYIQENKMNKKETVDGYLRKAHRFIRYIEDWGVTFNLEFVDANFKALRDSYNIICEKSRHHTRYYNLSADFRAFFFGNQLRFSKRKRPIIEIEEKLPETQKNIINNYKDFLVSRRVTARNRDHYCNSLIRFTEFLEKEKAWSLSDVNEINANELYSDCWEKKGFLQKGKNFRKEMRENPVQEVEWLKLFLEFIKINSSEKRTKVDQAPVTQQAPLITLSSEEGDETDNQNNTNLPPSVELPNFPFFDEDISELLCNQQTAMPVQDAAPQLERTDSTFSINGLLNECDQQTAMPVQDAEPQLKRTESTFSITALLDEYNQQPAVPVQSAVPELERTASNFSLGDFLNEYENEIRKTLASENSPENARYAVDFFDELNTVLPESNFSNGSV